MQIIIDTSKDSHEDIRNAAGFLLHLIGDLNDDPKEIASVAATAAAAGAVTAVAAALPQNVLTVSDIPPPPSGLFVPPPPPLVPADSSEESNVLSFPVPPPPPPPPPIADTAAPIPPAPPAPSVVDVGTVASVNTAPIVGGPSSATIVAPDGPSGVDSAGMTYDKRIHQKTGNKKKDGTWKLIKGIDPAVVAAVTAELAASKGAVAPVSLPGVPAPPLANAGTLPVPPVPPAVPATATGVPTPPTPPPVPVPPIAAIGAVSPYRALIERITTAAKEAKITPARVNELCQNNGVPNLMQLDKMPEKFDIVCCQIDAAIAGLG